MGIITLGLSNYLTAESSDKKHLTRLRKHLVVAPKDNPCVSMYRIMGYGGGWAEFSDGHKFGFCTDNALFQAENMIDNYPPYRIISRIQS
jgi:hypothetical protein